MTRRSLRLALLLVAVSCATGPGRRAGPAAPPGGARPPAPAETGAPVRGAPPAPPGPTAAPSAEGGAAPAPRPELPAPLPPPEPGAMPPALAPADPLELLWSHRLNFVAGGEPIVTIRLMEGQREIAFRTRARARVTLRGGGAVEVPAGARLRVRLLTGTPARLVHAPLLAEAPAANHERVEAARRREDARGVRTHTRVVGGVYGLAGRVIDNRRELLLGDPRPPVAGHVFIPELVERPRGTLELVAEGGAPLGTADTDVMVEVEGDAGFTVEGVEHDLGAERAREDRRYRGALHLTVDAGGRLAAVDALPLEQLLRGLVPSEMPGASPLEALKAQAVTARSNVLAQIGTRHLTDPYMLCAEVHCQAYRGEGAHGARTDEAVRATAGEALFDVGTRTLVNGVYSASCGGHGEDNDLVWGNTPDQNLRGRPDVPEGDGAAFARGLGEEEALRRFLSAPSDAYCGRPGVARNFRWERRFGAGELDGLVAELRVGRVRALELPSRGVSGRARTLRVVGSAGTAEVQGELRIRRLLRNLPSAMFVVDRDRRGDWVLRGGGWGHGAGMCQWGAVGRANAGQDYRAILRAYFTGAEVANIR